MSDPTRTLDDERLTVTRDFALHLQSNRLDTFESWYDEMIVGLPMRQTGGRANLRVSIEYGGDRQCNVFLKRHEPVAWWRRTLAWLRLRRPVTPARDEWNNLFLVSSLGIETCRPVVLGEDPATGRSFIVTAEIEDAKPADDFARERLASDTPGIVRARRRFVRRLAELVRRLHAARVSHRDLYLCHVFVREGREDFEMRLIDLQRLARFALSRWRVKDVAQLEFSRPPGVFTRTDLARFLRAYFATDRLQAKHKRFARAVRRKAEHIRRRQRPQTTG